MSTEVPPSNPPSAPKRRGLPRPTSAEAIAEQIYGEYAGVTDRFSYHNQAARHWEMLAKTVALIIAFTAATSTLSIFADNKTAAAIFAILTAAISAINASYEPATIAKAHHEAATGYEILMRPLWNLWLPLQPETTYNPQTGQYERATKLTDRELSAIWEEFSGRQHEIEALIRVEPAVNWSKIERFSRKAAQDEAEAWTRYQSIAASAPAPSGNAQPAFVNPH